MKKFFASIFLAGMIFFNAVTSAAPAPVQNRDTLYQIALLQSLAMGYFDGSISVKDLKTHGDTGIGTFEGLDGEMIVLDGVVYRANQNCKINVVKDNVLVPFSNVTFFRLNDAGGGEIYRFHSKEDIEASLTADVTRDDANHPHMVKIHGTFNSITVRSEAKQSKPYPTLVEALKATQKEFTFKNIKGTLVGLYTPEYMSSLNSTGWHFHFISDDKKIGGHVLEMDIERASYELQKLNDFVMVLPKDKNFRKLNFGRDMKEDIHKAEHDSYQGGK